ncbi:MAG TPA: pilin [Gammaproteobacteria bacterium]|nr:pilin [Gammaproteobacteria bacterium]
MRVHLARGFTLIELMLIVAIIAILAAIAIPAYNDFTVRSKVSEGITLASTAQLALAEYYLVSGDWPADNHAAGLSEASDLTGEYVASIQVVDNTIEVLFKNNAGEGLNDQMIIFQAHAGVGTLSWRCMSPEIEAKFLPPNCRS